MDHPLHETFDLIKMDQCLLMVKIDSKKKSNLYLHPI